MGRGSGFYPSAESERARRNLGIKDDSVEHRAQVKSQQERLAVKGTDGVGNLYWQEGYKDDSGLDRGRFLASEPELTDPDAPLLSEGGDPYDATNQNRLSRSSRKASDLLG